MIIKGALSQKLNEIDWNYNLIVLIKSFVWKFWISKTSNLILKL